MSTVRRAIPPVRVPHPHVVDLEGRSVIEGTRVPVARIFSWHRQGTTVETLLRRYPQLGPARIFDALAFAYDNLDHITGDLCREREELAAQVNADRERERLDALVSAASRHMTDDEVL